MPTRVYNGLVNSVDAGRSGTAGDHEAAPTSMSLSRPKPALPGGELKYAKAIMKLSDILEDYDLRTGDYALLSQPSSPGSNGVSMNLNHGTLTLYMPASIYQRAGLTFPTAKIASGGRKHEKGSMRYRVAIDLRAPSMVKGKNGFDRLMHAGKNVDGLREGRVWLFADVGEDSPVKGAKRKRKRDLDERDSKVYDEPTATKPSSALSQNPTPTATKAQEHPLSAHHPILVTDQGTTRTQRNVLVPSIVSDHAYLSTLERQTTASRAHTSTGNHLPNTLEEDIHELVEYLGLLFLHSPRITRQDYGKVDTSLCRYTLPTSGSADIDTAAKEVEDERSEGGDVVVEAGTEGVQDAAEANVTVEEITTVRYSGFVSAAFVMQLVVDVVRRSRAKAADDEEPGEVPEDLAAWVVVNVHAHNMEARGGIDGYAILLQSHSSNGAAGGGRVDKPADLEPRYEERDVDVNVDVQGDEYEQGSGRKEQQEKEKKEGEKEIRPRGFRYATCFEFVDSMT